MTTIETQSTTFTLGNILSVEAGTNCPQGGDSGHGGRTLLRLGDSGSTSWKLSVDGWVFDDPSEIEIVLAGDHEAETFISALEFAAKVLRQRYGNLWLDEIEEGRDKPQHIERRAVDIDF